MQLSSSTIASFQHEVWEHYQRYGRHDLPWRHDTSDYSIFISEVMLQQTQVTRVISKYYEFRKQYVDFAQLATAPLADVLRLWSGLGYNRRARYLKEAAIFIVNQHQGVLPRDTNTLQGLPGIGPNTAGSIRAFAHNLDVVFIETNIRSLYIHYFFPDTQQVADKDIYPLIEQTLEGGRTREWYWALMDYGAYIKQNHRNPSRASKHYSSQSRFEGSLRQLRGEIIRQLLEGEKDDRQLHVLDSKGRVSDALQALIREGLIEKTKTGAYHLKQ